MALTKLAEKPWTYTLYQRGADYILSVVCGGVAMYELNIPVGADLARRGLADAQVLEQLAAKIAADPHTYAPDSVAL